LHFAGYRDEAISATRIGVIRDGRVIGASVSVAELGKDVALVRRLL
jgi:hypothetical protein